MTSLRNRLTIPTAATVGVPLVLISVVAYVALRSELRGQVDDTLTAQYDQLRARLGIVKPGERFPPPPARAGGPAGPPPLNTSTSAPAGESSSGSGDSRPRPPATAGRRAPLSSSPSTARCSPRPT